MAKRGRPRKIKDLTDQPEQFARADFTSAQFTDLEAKKKKQRGPSMFGAKDIPRCCPKCKSDQSHILRTAKPNARMVVRYRRCMDCGQNWASREPVEIEQVENDKGQA